MTTVEETKDWYLASVDNSNQFVVIASWAIFSKREGKWTWYASGDTPYAAWFNAFVTAGFTKYLAHDLAIERLGVRSEREI